MRTKLIAFEIVLLVISVGVFLWSSQSAPVDQGTTDTSDSPAFPNLPVDRLKQIELHHGGKTLVFEKQNLPSDKDQKGKQDGQQKKGPRNVTKEKGAFRPDFKPDWVLKSYHNYGVREDLVKERIIEPLRSLKRGEVRSRTKEGLSDFRLDKENRDRLVLKGEQNNVLVDVALGKRTTDFEEQQQGRFSPPSKETEYIYYHKVGGSDGSIEVRLGESEFGELPVDPQEWVFKKIMSFEDRDVNFITLQKNKSPDTQKLYVLRRKPKKPGSNEDDSSEKNGENSNEQKSGSKDGSDSLQFTDWTLHVGDYYGKRPMALLAKTRQPIRVNEKELVIPGVRGNQTIRNPVKKEKASQSSADSLFRTLSSLEAERVSQPLTIGANQNKVPTKKLEKYGLARPEVILYLGRWDHQKGVAGFNARYYVGKKKKGEDETAYYISSLQTAGSKAAKFFGGLFGGQKTRKQIPVYQLSSSDRDTLTKVEDLIKKEEEKKNGKKGKGGESTPSEKKKKLQERLKKRLKQRKKSGSGSSSKDEEDTSEDSSADDQDGSSESEAKQDETSPSSEQPDSADTPSAETNNSEPEGNDQASSDE